jgi:hypothetical protein
MWQVEEHGWARCKIEFVISDAELLRRFKSQEKKSVD